MGVLIFLVWLISLNKKPPVPSGLLLVTGFHCVDMPNFFIHSSVDGHFCSCVTSATKNMGVQMLLPHAQFIFFRYTPSQEFVDHVIDLFLSFLFLVKRHTLIATQFL